MTLRFSFCKNFIGNKLRAIWLSDWLVFLFAVLCCICQILRQVNCQQPLGPFEKYHHCKMQQKYCSQSRKDALKINPHIGFVSDGVCYRFFNWASFGNAVHSLNFRNLIPNVRIGIRTTSRWHPTGSRSSKKWTRRERMLPMGRSKKWARWRIWCQWWVWSRSDRSLELWITNSIKFPTDLWRAAGAIGIFGDNPLHNS